MDATELEASVKATFNSILSKIINDLQILHAGVSYSRFRFCISSYGKMYRRPSKNSISSRSGSLGACLNFDEKQLYQKVATRRSRGVSLGPTFRKSGASLPDRGSDAAASCD